MLATGPAATPAAADTAGAAAGPAAGPSVDPATAMVRGFALSGRFPYLGAYLFYLATVARGMRLLADSPWRYLALALLIAYGALLVLQPRFTAGQGWRRLAYMLLQTCLAISLQAIPPRLEVFSTLYIPLSLQAVLLFGQRLGWAWIAVFVLAVIVPVTKEFGQGMTGIVMIGMYGSIFFVVGYFAALIQNAQAARAENERLIGELRMAHTRLAEHAEQAGQVASAQERRRMARELHDSATQTIFGMNMAVQAARVLLQRQPERVPEQLVRLQQLGLAATGEIQALARQLQPLPTGGSELGEAMQRIAAERAARDNLLVRVELTGRRDLPQDVEATLCRILQEALNNVAKHAGAREAWVRLNLAPEGASLEVEDHGAGFEPGAIPAGSGHVGLAGMAERAREIGWQFHLDARPGQGTRIRLEEGRG